MSDLGDFLAGLTGSTPATGISYGTVTAASPLTVALAGSTTAVAGLKRLASYTPAVGDVVAVWKDGAARLVLGKVA